MRSIDGLVARQKHLDDLVVVVVGGKDERRNVRRKLTLLIRTKERVFLRASTQLRTGDIVGMFNHHLQDIIVIIITIITTTICTPLDATVVQCVKNATTVCSRPYKRNSYREVLK